MKEQRLFRYWNSYIRAWIQYPSDKIKLGRWQYCKYCYSNVVLKPHWTQGIVVCTRCGYGLGPIREIQDAGSYDVWYASICAAFAEHCKGPSPTPD
jgi:hypothetical protein